jgi:hypothetical protein
LISVNSKLELVLVLPIGIIDLRTKERRGFVTLENWLGEYDALFLRRDRADPMIVLPWRVWALLLGRVCRRPWLRTVTG